VTVRTAAGPVALARPKLRGTSEAFASCLFGSHVTKTNALESLVIASFVAGLSVRDVEATLAEALGDQAAISKSTVSAICQAIKDDYQAWAARRRECPAAVKTVAMPLVSYRRGATGLETPFQHAALLRGSGRSALPTKQNVGDLHTRNATWPLQETTAEPADTCATEALCTEKS